MGWIVHHHGLFFADEFGWNEKYEAWAAETVARFIGGHEEARERCWVAEMDGEIVGSVLLVRESGEVASLKLLLVEPQAQGVGIGSRLVHECLRFAKRAGYRAVRAETASVLTDARRIFQKSGFTVIATAGVKLSENGQFENAAIAGLGKAAPGPSDREEDDFSIGCGRRYLEESGTFIPAVYEHFRNGADSDRQGNAERVRKAVHLGDLGASAAGRGCAQHRRAHSGVQPPFRLVRVARVDRQARHKLLACDAGRAGAWADSAEKAKNPPIS